MQNKKVRSHLPVQYFQKQKKEKRTKIQEITVDINRLVEMAQTTWQCFLQV